MRKSQLETLNEGDKIMTIKHAKLLMNFLKMSANAGFNSQCGNFRIFCLSDFT